MKTLSEINKALAAIVVPENAYLGVIAEYLRIISDLLNILEEQNEKIRMLQKNESRLYNKLGES